MHNYQRALIGRGTATRISHEAGTKANASAYNTRMLSGLRAFTKLRLAWCPMWRNNDPVHNRVAGFGGDREHCEQRIVIVTISEGVVSASQCPATRNSKSLFPERPRLAISSFVTLRGASHMYFEVGEDRTFQFGVWAEFITSIVPQTQLQPDSSS